MNNPAYALVEVQAERVAAAIHEAIALAKQRGQQVAFEWNMETIVVAPDSNPALLYRDFHRAAQGCIGRIVGPYPEPVLSPEQLADDRRKIREIDDHNYELRIRDLAERARQAEEAMADAPEMTFSTDGEAIWRQAQVSDIAKQVAERWARIMQKWMATGRPLADIWEAAHIHSEWGTDAKTPDYDQALGLLAKCWVHGELFANTYPYPIPDLVV
jgi:hypothetical protein